MSCILNERSRIASGLLDLGRDLVAIAREPVEARNRNAVERLNLEDSHRRLLYPRRFCEVRHERDQRVDAGFRHRVVEARAHSADDAVTLQIGEARGLRFLQERLVELGIGERERHVHPRARGLLDGIGIETRTRRSRRRASLLCAR